MDMCFEGAGQVAVTFQAAGSVQPGMVVALTKSGTVGKGADNALPCGVALGNARGGAVAVQIAGTAKVAYSGTAAPAAGWQSLACDGKGGVKAAATGGLSCLVLAVDTEEKTAVVKL